MINDINDSLWPWKYLQKRAAGVSLQSKKSPCYCSVYVFLNSDDRCEQKAVETKGVCNWKREDYQVFVQMSTLYLFFLTIEFFIASICGNSFVEVQFGYSAVKKYLSLLWFLRFLDTVFSHTYVSHNQTNYNIMYYYCNYKIKLLNSSFKGYSNQTGICIRDHLKCLSHYWKNFGPLVFQICFNSATPEGFPPWTAYLK